MSCSQRGGVPAGAISLCQTKKTHTSWYSPAWLDSHSSCRQAIFNVFLRSKRGSDSQSHGGKARDSIGEFTPAWLSVAVPAHSGSHLSLSPWGSSQPSPSILHACVQTDAALIHMQFKPPVSFGKCIAFENTFERKPKVNWACPKPHVQDPRWTQRLCSGLRAWELRVCHAFYWTWAKLPLVFIFRPTYVWNVDNCLKRSLIEYLED